MKLGRCLNPVLYNNGENPIWRRLFDNLFTRTYSQTDERIVGYLFKAMKQRFGSYLSRRSLWH